MNSFINRLQNMLARSRILRNPNISIHVSSQVAFRRIKITPDCRLAIGNGSMIDASIISDRAGARYRIGDNTFIGASHLISASSISIGSNVLISWGCWIVDHDSHAIGYQDRVNDVELWRRGEKCWDNVKISPVTVCDHAWIGFNSIILKGITIGRCAVIGAGSVVTKNIPDHCVAAGNPARVIRELKQ
jgi:acetyltransferase-like isoleucine patch superfamily enzyme